MVSDQLTNEVKEGRAAEQLLENTAFKAAFEGLERQIFDQLRKVGVNDAPLQTKLVLSLQLLAAIRTSIEQTIQTGQFAALSLEKPSAFKRLFG